MKKLIKALERIMIGGNYNDYRLIITPRHIDLKLTPISDKGTESNWIKENTKEAIEDLMWNLNKHY